MIISERWDFTIVLSKLRGSASFVYKINYHVVA